MAENPITASSRSEPARDWKGWPPYLAALLEFGRQALPVELGVLGLPVDAGDRRLIDHHQGGRSGPHGGRKIGGGDFLHVQLDHHVLGDLAAFGGPVLEPAQAVFHFGDPALQARGQRFVLQGGPQDGLKNFVQVCEALDCVGEGPLVDFRVLGPDAVADVAVVDGGEREVHDENSIWI